MSDYDDGWNDGYKAKDKSNIFLPSFLLGVIASPILIYFTIAALEAWEKINE